MAGYHSPENSLFLPGATTGKRITLSAIKPWRTQRLRAGEGREVHRIVQLVNTNALYFKRFCVNVNKNVRIILDRSLAVRLEFR
jgi:hypothetical protein